VPEINASVLNYKTKIIANPNCSTIQMVLALSLLHQHLKIKRLVVSTYQSVSGTGQKAMEQLMNERTGTRTNMVYPHPIDMNLFPHGGSFEQNGYTTEETKLLNETRKILGDNSIRVTATVVRVPVTGGHSEAVNGI
jgi:aspartate-semialdehyde dehydrogenase